MQKKYACFVVKMKKKQQKHLSKNAQTIIIVCVCGVSPIKQENHVKGALSNELLS
jgi:hypothetical protein